MKLSTQTSRAFGKLGEDAGLKLLADAGYDALDISMFSMCCDPECVWQQEDYREHAAALRKKCEDYGMYFNQGHSPFSYKFNEEGVFENRFMPDTIRSIEVAGLLGVRNLVIHPLHHFVYAGHAQEIFEKNMEFYRSLIPYAEAAGVKISLENMWQRDPIRKYIVDDTLADPAEMNAYIDELNSFSPVFNACLDIGHVVLVGRDPAEVIRTIGGRLEALHVHDNNYLADQHTVIGHGRIDYNAVIQALHDTGYKGEFTYEADAFFANFELAEFPLAAKFMQDVGRYWISKYEAL